MTSRVLEIKRRNRRSPSLLASLADFTYIEGKGVDPEAVLNNPNVSLYCLDDERKQAIFVEIPPNVGITSSPFTHLIQYQQAQRLMAVSYDTFTELADRLAKIDQLIFIFLTGRSGSTLLSNLLNQTGKVTSLTEVSIANQFVYLRDPQGLRDYDLCQAINATVRFLFKPSRVVNSRICSLKFRSESIQTMDLFHITFPLARKLFLYRDAVGFVASFYRILRRAGVPDYEPLSAWLPFFQQGFKKDSDYLATYLEADGTSLSLTKSLTLWWLFSIESYMAHYERGIPVLAVRYDDLNTQREKVLNKIFEYCDIPIAWVPRALNAFEQDSQAGTFSAREDPKKGNSFKLNDDQLAELHGILQRQQVIKTPDYILPGTLVVGH